MNAVITAMTRASSSIGADVQPRKTDADTLHAALRADRRSRDERTARLRAMLLAVGEVSGS